MAKPWYYVKGRKDLTEALIATRREKEAQREENWRNTQKYFNRCNFETKLHHQWNKERYLQRIRRPNGEEKAPYDLDYDCLRDKAFVTEMEKEQKETTDKLASMVKNINRLEVQSYYLKLMSEKILQKITELLQARKSLTFQRQSWTIRENRIHYMRFCADKLKHKGHLICQQLYYYKSVVLYLADMAADLVTGEEKAEVEEVVDGGLKIIRMYLNINYRRNTEFTQLFQEEAECRWLLQKPEWNREKEVWQDLVDRIMDVFFTLFKDKLEENLAKEKELLQRRDQSFNLLTAIIDDLKENPYLSKILNVSVKDLLSESESGETEDKK